MAYAAGSAIRPLLAGMVKLRMGWEAATLVLTCLSGASVVPIALWAGAPKPLEVKDHQSAA